MQQMLKIMKEGKKRVGKGYLMGVVAVVFMIIGYQTALFVYHSSIMKITAGRDLPDTVFVYRQPSVHQESRQKYSSQDEFVVRKNSHHTAIANAVRENMPRRKVESFRFNPNTVSEEDLCRLGFTPKQAASIVTYRQKGGRFRRKTDFADSFVVSDSIYKRLESYIDIPLIDLNLADSAAFDELPGIGGWYASKMVAYRDELKGYSYKEQLMDIWKFDRKKFDALSDLITVDPEYIVPYPLWTLPADSLRKHPYIKNYETARAIVLYRENTPKDEVSISAMAELGIISVDSASRLDKCAIE